MLRYLRSSGAIVPKVRGSLLRPKVALLVRFWTAFIGVLITGALVLQVLGPPRHSTPVATQETPVASGVRTAGPAPTSGVPATRVEPKASGPSSPKPTAAELASSPAAMALSGHDVPKPSTSGLPAGTHPGPDALRLAFQTLNRKAAPGLDSVTGEDSEADLEPRLADPHGRQPSPSSPPAGMPADASVPAPAATPAPPSETLALIPQPQVGEPSVARVEEPEMIAIAGGSFRMGSGEDASEQPLHTVTVKPFMMAKYPVTVKQWNACVAAKVCDHVVDGADDAPVSNVSWSDAQRFIAWLSETSQQHYRLPSEAEWEYAARGGTETRYWWGNAMKAGLADCKGCGGPRVGVQPDRVGALSPNPFGLYDIGGGIEEWVEDCWHKDYHGAPVDGSAWLAGDCREHVLRGGSWRNDTSSVRSASRNYYDATVRYPAHGLRLARSL